MLSIILRAKHPALSPRQRQILDQRAQGLAYKEIADMLDISISTVKSHMAEIFRKLDVTTTLEALWKCPSVRA
jgi:LuxR family maltose regulon positive regulatory protein